MTDVTTSLHCVANLLRYTFTIHGQIFTARRNARIASDVL